MTSTCVTQHIHAPRDAVCSALLDPRAIAAWKTPDGMTCRVHQLEAREGGTIRISLTHDRPTGTGKTPPHTDIYHGRFAKPAPNEQVVEADEPASSPIMAGD